MLTVGELVRATGGSLLSGSRLDPIRSISIDSRSLQPGCAFFALRGPRFDGHEFLWNAGDRGAAVLVMDRVERLRDLPDDRSPALVQVDDSLTALQRLGRHQRERSEAIVIGVAGSNGKTTTKEMLAGILRLAGPTLATRGNLNNQIGLPLMLTELSVQHRFAVIEMGTSKKGDMKLLAELTRPQVALITNVGKDHLEFLDTPEGVLQENRLLFDLLPDDGIAIINADDPLLASLAAELPCRTIVYGGSAEADVRYSDIRTGDESAQFTLWLETHSFPVQLSTTGLHQVFNAAAAAAVAWAVGVDPSLIVRGLEAFRAASMRMQAQRLASGAIVVNDAYNANPSSMRASIDSFCQSYSKHPRWLVLGDMRELGALARQEHVDLGRWLAGQPIEGLFLYGRDARFIQDGVKDASASFRVERFKKKSRLGASLVAALEGAQPAVLFKASRRMRLEDLLVPLLGAGVAAGH